MKLYLDDLRQEPEGWTAVRSIPHLLSALRTGAVTHVSLDYDLVNRLPRPGDPNGLEALKAMKAAGTWPSVSLRVHSGDPDGAQAMKAYIRANAPAHLQRPTTSPYTAAANRRARITGKQHY